MTVRTDLRDGVGLLTLDRPERAHAYDGAMLDAIEAGLDALAAARVIVVGATGEGAFCGGADLDAMRGATWRDALVLRSQRVFTRLARLDAVTVAAVHGPAVAGGFELALACDLRVAGPRARFSLPETALGIVPSAGGTTRLARLVGVSRAKAVILGGAVVDAATALGWGLVHRLADDPRAEAEAWARAVAARDGAALARAKALLDAGEPDLLLLGERVVEAGLYLRR